MEPEGSLPHLQVPTTCQYPEPAQSSPYPTSHFQRSISILSSHLHRGVPSGLIQSGFPTKTLYTPLFSLSALHAPSLIIVDFITRTILGEEYGSWSSSLESFRHFLVTSSLLGPNILLYTLFSNTLFSNTLFSNTLSLRSFLNVSGHDISIK
jgi:hypothetical protein